MTEPSDEPVEWSPPVVCPACGSEETRLMVELPSDIPTYECERCRSRFEAPG